tara:strand:- start:5032 stop:5745 length:714 start_codon:yes stop_codon:yes gene_type:complete
MTQQKAKPRARSRKTSEVTYKGAAHKTKSGLKPKTLNQGSLITAIKESSQVIVFGPAGTGKTYVTASAASDMFLTKEVEKIVITRPMVSVGKDIGILPGELIDKVSPWALPVLDILIKHLGKGTVETALKAGNIEIAPLALMRGRSFDDAFIICDEAQNITTAELKMLLTRVGEDTTIVLNGDVQQTDLRGDSGLITITNVAKKHNIPVPIIEFTLDDIVRSDICAMWTRAFYEEKI